MAEKYDESEGVWRTIAGRRVFIRTGQSLSGAMKESGKFPKYKAKKKEEGNFENLEQYEIYDRADKLANETEDANLRQEINKRLDRIDNANKRGSGYGQKPTEELREILKRENIKKEAIKGARGTKEKDEIKEQGSSNRKEVKERIQRHIMENYADEDNPQEAFVKQMEAMNYGNNRTAWGWGKEMAKGGNYLIYTEDMRNFLDKLKINPKNKKFTDEQVFETYTNLIGRESETLYRKIRKK